MFHTYSRASPKCFVLLGCRCLALVGFLVVAPALVSAMRVGRARPDVVANPEVLLLLEDPAASTMCLFKPANPSSLTAAGATSLTSDDWDETIVHWVAKLLEAAPAYGGGSDSSGNTATGGAYEQIMLIKPSQLAPAVPGGTVWNSRRNWMVLPFGWYQWLSLGLLSPRQLAMDFILTSVAGYVSS